MAVWKNWSGLVKASPEVIIYPTSEEEIVDMVRMAGNEGKKIRVAGSGHSFPDIVATKDIIVSLDKMQGIVAQNENLFTVWAGTKLKKLGKLLFERGYAMENMGDIDAQSIAGAVSTGTHGTGKDFGILATQLVGIRFIDSEGNIVEMDETHPDFKAAQVSLGTLGILTQVTLRTVPAYILHYRTKKGRMADVTSELDQFVNQNRNFEFYWFPHTETVQLKESNISNELPKDRRVRNFINDRIFENMLWGVLCFATRIVPPLCKPVSKIAAASLSTFEKINWSHKVYPTERRVRFYEMEYSLPVDNGIDALLEIKDMIKERNVRVQFPLEFRIVRGDDIFISPAYGGDRCFIAVHMYKGMKFEDYFRNCEKIFLEHEGRPHWGKLHHLKAEDLKEKYSRWNRFREAQEKYDPSGLFMTPYLESLFSE